MSFGHVDCWVGEVDHFVICGLRGFEGSIKGKELFALRKHRKDYCNIQDKHKIFL